MTRITVLRPDEPDAEPARISLAPRRELPDRIVLGLVANGKPLAKELLGVLTDELSIRLARKIDVELLEKPSASYTISAEEADVLAVRSHLVISGLGD